MNDSILVRNLNATRHAITFMPGPKDYRSSGLASGAGVIVWAAAVLLLDVVLVAVVDSSRHRPNQPGVLHVSVGDDSVVVADVVAGPVAMVVVKVAVVVIGSRHRPNQP